MRRRSLILSESMVALDKALSPNVIWLGLVSCLADISSEMVYPLLPAFLAIIASTSSAAVYIGIMDGLADTIAGLLKLASGRLSDRTGRRKGWAIYGYSLSAIARSIVALASVAWQVVAIRLIDRIGKGIRTSPRDALLAGAIDQRSRGLAFSFHRMMDHIGALTGPLLALLIIYLVGGKAGLWVKDQQLAGSEVKALRWVFGLSAVPGLLAVAILKAKVTETPIAQERPISTDCNDGPCLGLRFYALLAAVGLFSLGNSSDLFILLFAQARLRFGPGSVILLWCLLHLAKIIFSLPGGRLSDRFGRPRLILTGWMVYIFVYAMIPFVVRPWQLLMLLVVYGVYYGLTEGAQLAFVADLVPAARRGWAYGLFNGLVAIAALPASLLFGVLFWRFGPPAAFLVGSGLAGCGAAILLGLIIWPGR